jgi:sugar lactone lactonase YvrE
MATSPDGSTVYIARTSGVALAVVARDAKTGIRKWGVRTSGPGGAQIFAEAVAISPDGRLLFVTGDVEQTIDTRSAMTIAYDTAKGSIVWSTERPVAPNREFIPQSIVVSPKADSVYVTGSRTGTHGIDDFWDYLTLSYSTANGTEQWSAAYNRPANRGDTAEGIGVSPDNTQVFVTGTSVAAGDSRDFATIAYSAKDGSQQSASRYEAGTYNFAANLAVNPTGSRVTWLGREERH